MRLCIFTIIALCLVGVCRSAEEDYEYEDEQQVVAAPVVPVTTPAPARNAGRLSLLSPRGRGPARKPAVAAAPSTTAKPVPEIVEEIEEGEPIEDENLEEEVVAPTTTTEAPKTLRGGVRPFRSNEDLLAALKRRRAQVSSNSIRESHAATEAADHTTPRPKSISSNNSRSRGGQSSDSSGSRTSRGRFGSSRTTKPVQEEAEEESRQDEAEVKSKSYRRG